MAGERLGVALRPLFVISQDVKLTRLPISWFAVGILLLMFGLALTSMAADSPTFDEQGFLVRGLAYLRGEENGGKRDIRVGHPLGLNAVNASLLVNDPSIKLPSNDPSWNKTSFHRPAELFLWEIGNDVERMMFLARLPALWLGLLLAAVGSRWASEMAASWRSRLTVSNGYPHLAGLIALVLLAFDPNLLAHARLVTTDVGLTAAAAAAGYTMWRFVRRPTQTRAIVAGSALGLLLNTKFTALLFLPLFGMVIVLSLAKPWRQGDSKTRQRLLLATLIIYPLIALLTLWAGHGFQIGSLSAPLPFVGNLGGLTVPLSSYFDQLLDIGNRLDVSTPSFLLGNYSDSGWWYYFPVAFLLKTPLPVLLLLFWTYGYLFNSAARREPWLKAAWVDLAALNIPAIGFFIIALTTDINLGYRHLLPILPFLFVLIAVVVGKVIIKAWQRHAIMAPSLAGLFLCWLILASIWIYPHYLAFFNVLAGGPDGGWRALVDSNLDWGQDLKRLARWQSETDPGQIWLSYFGEARPDYYGIDYIGLDSFAPRLMNPKARPFFPHNPAPGWYAISATNLQGVHFANHEQFSVFREREPDRKIGYSIFLYHQPGYGDPVDLLLGNVQLDQISAEDFAALGTNDVTLRWFDANEGVLIPDGSRPIWLAVDGSGLNAVLGNYLSFDGLANQIIGDSYSLGEITPRLHPERDEAIELFHGDSRIAFYNQSTIEVNDDSIEAVTMWRQLGEPSPVKIFVHALDPSGNIVTQWDGIAAEWEGWRTGDTLVQLHDLSLESVPSGNYRIVAGLYNPENMRRWHTSSGADVLELGVITVP